MQWQISELSRNMILMQEIFMKQNKQSSEDSGQVKAQKGERTLNPGKVNSNPKPSQSDTTVYQNVLEQVKENPLHVRDRNKMQGNNHFSSSSSDVDYNFNSSNQLMDFEDMFIAECEVEAWVQSDSHDHQSQVRTAEPVQDHEDDIVQEAEATKARMFTMPGKNMFNVMENKNKSLAKAHNHEELYPNHHHSVVDEEYLVVGGHID